MTERNIENPALVGARIELSAGIIDACCLQIDLGDIPARELTDRIRLESQALRQAVNRDNQNATAERLLTAANGKVKLEEVQR